MKSVLISIQPKWCELIASGKKTVEVRKTKPKLDVPFKCYIYCTKDKPTFTQSAFCDDVSNGRVIGEFVCDYITSLKADNMIQAYYNNTKETCLTDEEIKRYANNGKLYYWHISDLVIYDKPRELSEFVYASTVHTNCFGKHTKRVTRPPQSWCYVEEL